MDVVELHSCEVQNSFANAVWSLFEYGSERNCSTIADLEICSDPHRSCLTALDGEEFKCPDKYVLEQALPEFEQDVFFPEKLLGGWSGDLSINLCY